EVLADRPLGGGGAPVGGRADRLGGAGVQRMEAAAVHAFENDDVAAGVDDAARDRDLCFAGPGDGGRHHLSGAVVGQAFAVGDVHGASAVVTAELCVSAPMSARAAPPPPE